MNNVKFSALWSLLIASSLSLLFSCKGPSTKPLPSPELEGKRSPEEIQQIIDERIRSIRTVEGHLTIISKKEPYSGRYKALLFFMRPNQFRFKIFQTFGPTLSDLVMKGNSIEAYIPNKNTVFKADLGKGPQPKGPGPTPLDSIKGILQVDIDKSGEVSLSHNPEGDTVLDHFRGKRLVKKTEVDSKSLLIKRETLFDLGGQPYLITGYAEYKKTNGHWWPFRIEFREPMKEPFMSFEFQNVKINGPVEPDIFRLKLPPNVTTVHQ